MTQYNSENLPSYSNPPVIEVVFGVSFKKLDAMKLPHSGIFWQKIREDFPKCAHASPLVFSKLSPLIFSKLEESEFPLPRVWLINKNETNLIQYQTDCFFFNWRRMPGAEEYPRYSIVKSAFERYHKVFKEFINENELGEINYQQCELTYINHIVKGSGWNSLADIGQIMRDVMWTKKDDRFLPEPKAIQWVSIFPLPEDFGSLSVSLKHGTRQQDKCPLFLIEISAKGLGGDQTKERISKWFDLAHIWIVKTFADITSDEIQKKIWLRQENK